jgi:hypothetical protein
MVKLNRTKLTVDDVVSIRIARRLGVTVRHIARVSNVSLAVVCRITTEQAHVQAWSTRLSIYEDA